MIKKTLNYRDLEGNPKVGNYYFNVTKAELTKWAMVEDDDFAEKLQELAKTATTKEEKQHIIDIFEDIIRKAYGVRGADGEQFIKTPELYEAFASTDAYSELFMELVTDSDAAAEFINGMMPADFADKLPKTIQEVGTQVIQHLPRPVDYSAMTEADQQEALRLFHEKRASLQGGTQ